MKQQMFASQRFAWGHVDYCNTVSVIYVYDILYPLIKILHMSCLWDKKLLAMYLWLIYHCTVDKILCIFLILHGWIEIPGTLPSDSAKVLSNFRILWNTLPLDYSNLALGHGNTFCVTGLLWGKTTSLQLIQLTKGQCCRGLMFSLLTSTSFWKKKQSVCLWFQMPWYSYDCNDLMVNSLWPSDTIFQLRIGSTWINTGSGYYLMASSHYLNQCWLTICKDLWHPFEGIMIRICEDTKQLNTIEFFLYCF